MLCRRDCAERVVDSFVHQIQYELYGGNLPVSFEVVALEQFSETTQTKTETASQARTRHNVFH